MRQKNREKKRKWSSHKKIGNQIRFLYIVAILLPVTILGIFLMVNTYKIQEQYHSDLLESYNIGMKRTMFEITSQVYAVSDSIVYNQNLIDFVKTDYENESLWKEVANSLQLTDKYIFQNAGIDEVRIYIDSPYTLDYKAFYSVDEEIKNADWYKKACNQYSAFWISLEEIDVYGNPARMLTLVRKMVIAGSNTEVVVMIKVKDTYLDSRFENQGYIAVLTVNDMPAFYSNDADLRGKKLNVGIDYDRVNYNYSGMTSFAGKDSLIYISTLKPTMSSSTQIYMVTYDGNALENIREIIFNCASVLLVAILLPVFILTGFARSFTKQVLSLRKEMRKASQGEYEKMTDEFSGSEELSDAFDDLLIMVKNIQAMEAEQYESKINAQNIENEQQKMEFKMLASQINPHFLYNTLEMIRMKAVTAGDKEVATAIKLLGKSMRYVLENTGATDTTLQMELNHILNYLQIQQLRFGDRVKYQVNIQPWMELESYRILPLLLQPIVENAISHGLEGQEEGCIWIAIYIMDDKVHIDISDNGCGMDENKLAEVMQKVEDYTRIRRKSSIGLYNINRRIKLSYGDEYGISIASTPGEGTRVSILIPEIYRTQPTEETKV